MAELLQVEDYQEGGSDLELWPWTLTLTSQKVTVTFWRRCWTSVPNSMNIGLYFCVITASTMNERAWSQYLLVEVIIFWLWHTKWHVPIHIKFDYQAW